MNKNELLQKLCTRFRYWLPDPEALKSNADLHELQQDLELVTAVELAIAEEK